MNAPPEICPQCGTEVPRGARACPECGSDEHTGWNEHATLARLGVPDDHFDRDEFYRQEFGAGEPTADRIKPRGISWLWWVLAVVCGYSLTKRFTDYTHVFLGAALALAPVGAWLAVNGGQFTGMQAIQMLVLAGAVVLWLVGFDIIYALQDYEFDRTHGLHSLVVAWGPKNALQAAFLAHIFMSGLLFLFGLLCRFGLAYLVGWAIIVACLVLEHWIAHRRGMNWIQVSFFRLNAVVSSVFLAITASEVIFRGFRLR